MEEEVAVGFEKYLLSQTKRSSQNYQLWLLCKRVIRARRKANVPAPESAELGRKLSASSSQVRNRLSDLMAFYQEYLAVLRIRSTPRLGALLALEQAVETNNENYVNWAEKKVDRLVTEGALNDTNAFHDSLRFNRMIYEWYAEKYNRVYAEKTSVLYQELNKFTLIEKCKLYLDAKSIIHDDGLVLKKLDHEIIQLRAARENDTGEDAFSFSENIYYHLYLIVKTRSVASYRFVFSVFEEVFKQFTPRDARFVLVVLTNRIAREVMIGNNEAQQDYFKMIVTLLDYPKVRVTEWMLKNIVTVLCRMRKGGLAEIVLNAYLPGLETHRQENSRCYNMAIIRMSTGDLEEATNLLNQITLSETIYYVGGRFILFRAMYKAGEYEGALSLAKSFKSYISRLKTMDANFKIATFHFLNYYNELVKLVQNKDFIDPVVFEKRTKQLLGKVTGTSAVVSRDWLIEEIEARL